MACADLEQAITGKKAQREVLREELRRKIESLQLCKKSSADLADLQRDKNSLAALSTEIERAELKALKAEQAAERLADEIAEPEAAYRDSIAALAALVPQAVASGIDVADVGCMRLPHQAQRVHQFEGEARKILYEISSAAETYVKFAGGTKRYYQRGDFLEAWLRAGAKPSGQYAEVVIAGKTWAGSEPLRVFV